MKPWLILDFIACLAGFFLMYMFGLNWVVLVAFLIVLLFLTIVINRKTPKSYLPLSCHLSTNLESKQVKINELKKRDIGRKVLWTHFGGKDIGILQDWSGDKIRISLESGSAWIVPISVEWIL